MVITGQAHLAPRAEQLGVPCLMKPFSADRLIEMVDKCFVRELAVSTASARAVLERRHA
jgi:hypothetical protein